MTEPKDSDDGNNTRGPIQFQREIDTIPVTINGVAIHSPFGGGLGGFPVPTFADIDADRDLDLFVGDGTGAITFYRNTGTSANPDLTLETDDFASIHVGLNSSPAFANIDADGDPDLFVGEFNGNINFYRNTGTANGPSFTLETENFASIRVGSRLTFADIDNNGALDLFVGAEGGNIYHYKNVGPIGAPDFRLETQNFANIDVGLRSVPAFADIDRDGDLDLFVGELDGNVNHYLNSGTPSNPSFRFVTDLPDIGGDSAPALADLNNDGTIELFVGGSGGNINYVPITVEYPRIRVTRSYVSIFFKSSQSTPTLADIDKDGDLDLFGGNTNGDITFYQNTGTASNPAFTFETDFFGSIDVGLQSAPDFADIDGDGDLDLFVGEEDGNINFYENSGVGGQDYSPLRGQHYSPLFSVGSVC